MASRWAFEALAVAQYKDNDYMALFFDSEKEMAKALFRSDILITELTGQTDMVEGWIRWNRSESDIFDKLLVIKNEMEKLDNEKFLPRFHYYNDRVN